MVYFSYGEEKTQVDFFSDGAFDFDGDFGGICDLSKLAGYFGNAESFAGY